MEQLHCQQKKAIIIFRHACRLYVCVEIPWRCLGISVNTMLLRACFQNAALKQCRSTPCCNVVSNACSCFVLREPREYSCAAASRKGAHQVTICFLAQATRGIYWYHTLSSSSLQQATSLTDARHTDGHLLSCKAPLLLVNPQRPATVRPKWQAGGKQIAFISLPKLSLPPQAFHGRTIFILTSIHRSVVLNELSLKIPELLLVLLGANENALLPIC